MDGCSAWRTVVDRESRATKRACEKSIMRSESLEQTNLGRRVSNMPHKKNHVEPKSSGAR